MHARPIARISRDACQPEPRRHHPLEKALPLKTAYERVHGKAVHDEVLEREREAAPPVPGVDKRSRLVLERATVKLHVMIDLFRRRLRGEHEREKLREIVLRRPESRELPVIGAELEARVAAAA
jgi:hypothetical protein